MSLYRIYKKISFCPARDLAQFQTLYEYYVEHKREICGAVNEVMCVDTVCDSALEQEAGNFSYQ